jgi:ATP diphosphatase
MPTVENPTILLIRTGGTIDAEAYPDPMNPPALVTPLNAQTSLIYSTIKPHGAFDKIDWTAEQEKRFVKDSQRFTAADISELASIINNAPQSYIIMTHGTDAMTDNAALLQKEIKSAQKTVFFVGAMVPLSLDKNYQSDGFAALRFAAETIGKMPCGVYVVGVNSATGTLEVFPAGTVKKDRKSSMDRMVYSLTKAGDKPPISALLDIMARLRDKDTGCPWDIEQDFKSIAKCTLEEAYEVVDAIDRNHMGDLKEELGDLLLQVVFHAQMAAEQNMFTFDDVVKTLTHKLVSRHPHVFGEADAKTSEDVMGIWQSVKDTEEKSKRPQVSILDDVPSGFPALVRTMKLSKKAAKAGFEWQKTEDVIDKIIEELEEFRAELRSGDREKQDEELGDVLFSAVQLGRRLDLDCEESLRKSNNKFYKRFSGMEELAKSKNKDLKSLSSSEWEEFWQIQKAKR